MLDEVAAAAEGTLSAAVFFGSRSSGVATNASSAYDLMLVCEDPGRFYRAMFRAGLLHRSPMLLGVLDGLLPPTQIRLVRGPWLVKASVLSLGVLIRATSAGRKDQFLCGRLFQDVHVVWARDEAGARAVEGAIESARQLTLDWVAPDLPATSHLVVVDGEGNAVSLTSSIESAFGSRLMVRGFLLNNQLTDFSFVPEADGKPIANRIEPGKRPRSAMAPIIALDAAGKRFEIAIGSPGGSQIIDYVARPLLAVTVWGMDMQSALSRPNVVNRNAKTELEAMSGQDDWLAETSAGLVLVGHEVEIKELNSGVQGIRRTKEGLEGGADPRREGLILGD